MPPPDTKQRILDVAEHFFAIHGYNRTSLRRITTAAKVNLAAVNYHFGSKQALLEAVIERRLIPLNHLRGQRLDAVEEEARKRGEPPAVREAS